MELRDGNYELFKGLNLLNVIVYTFKPHSLSFKVIISKYDDEFL